jgi:hypothetical protein
VQRGVVDVDADVLGAGDGAEAARATLAGIRRAGPSRATISAGAWDR